MVLDEDIPHDAALPQLVDVLNRSKMKRLFQDEFFSEGRLRIEDCSIERVKYKPGKNCLVCYRLEIRNRMTQQVFTQRFSTRVFEKGGAISRFEKAQLQTGVMPVLGRGVIHIPSLDMVIWVFPNDRKLLGLPKITDSIYLKEKLLPKLIGTALGPGWIISELSNAVVHYVPEHTCTVRVSLRLENSESNRTKAMTLYGKTYYNEEGREAHRMMAQLWDAEIRRTEQFRMAEPLGYDPETKSLWQIGLPGCTLLDQEMTDPRFSALLEGAAASVSALHRSGLSCSRSVDLKDWVVKLEEMRRVLPTAWPSCREMLAPLVDRLVLQSKQLKTHPAVTLHGDLHFKNFLVDDEKVSLIDLDNLCHGAPLQDIGSFLAGLFYRGILTQAPIERIEKIGGLFVRHYEKRVPWSVSRSELGWHMAAALINERAFRCLTRLKPGRREILDRLIRLADRISVESSEYGILSWRKQDGNLL